MKPLKVVLVWGIRVMTLLFVLPLLYLIEPFWRLRFGNPIDERIGHLVMNIDYFARHLQLRGWPKRTTFVLFSNTAANRTILGMWKRVFCVVEGRLPRFLSVAAQPILERTRFHIKLSFPYDMELHRAYSEAQPVLGFSEDQDRRGREFLKRIGMGENDWFICFHSRDPAYLALHRPNVPSKPSLRDCSILNYLPAVRWVTEQGCFAFRMGQDMSEDMPETDNPRIIDYAKHHRSDFLDAWLLGRCRFFLGNTSGLINIPWAFNLPTGYANYAPYRGVGIGKYCIWIPKLMKNREGRLLTFKEIDALGLLKKHYGPDPFDGEAAEAYESLGVQWVENDADDILGLAQDIMDSLKGNLLRDDVRALQWRFYARLQSGIDERYVGTLSPRFIRRHADLFV